MEPTKDNMEGGEEMESFEVPIRAMARVPYLIFLPQSEEELPEEEDLERVVMQSWEKHTDEQLREIGKDLYENHFLVFSEVYDKEDGLFRAFEELLSNMSGELSKEAKKRLGEAKTCILAWVSDQIAEPRAAAWFGMAGVRAVAQAYGGISLDASTARVLPLDEEEAEQEFNPQPVSIAEQILFLPGFSEDGEVQSASTVGLSKFGIPEIELHDIGGVDPFDVTKVVVGAAHALRQRAEEETEAHGDEVQKMTLLPLLRVRGEDVAQGFDLEEKEQVLEEQEALVGIRYEPASQPRPEELPPGFVPFIMDPHRTDYDGVLVLEPAEETVHEEGKHWVSAAAARLG